MTLAKPLFSVSLNFSTCLMERMLLNPTPLSGDIFRTGWPECFEVLGIQVFINETGCSPVSAFLSLLERSDYWERDGQRSGGTQTSVDRGSPQARVSQHALPMRHSCAASNYLAIEPWAALTRVSEGLELQPSQRPWVIYSFCIGL